MLGNLAITTSASSSSPLSQEDHPASSCQENRKQSPSLEISKARSLEIIQQFFQKHIYPHRLRHGTSSLYEAHFKAHGISATYPPALESLVQRVRNVWDQHFRLHAQTQYWVQFIRRYDKAKQHQIVAVSFSRDPSITAEFTRGARRGGEWIRELRGFLREAQSHPQAFTSEEHETLLETQELIDLFDTAPPMAVTIRAPVGPIFTFGSLEAFQAFIVRECPDWANPEKLQTYLTESIQDSVAKVQNFHHYEYCITHSIPPQNLEIEILEDQKSSLSNDYPKIPFDTPTTLTYEQVVSLRIRSNGFSELAEYADSKFDYQRCDNGFIITRKPLTEQDKAEKEAFIAKEEKKRAIRIRLLQQLGCEKLLHSIKL